MKLENGKFYRTRDGRRAGPAKYHGGSSWTSFTVPLDGHPATYDPHGNRIAPDLEDHEDLIAEWVDVDPNIIAAAPELLDALKEIEAANFPELWNLDAKLTIIDKMQGIARDAIAKAERAK